MDDPEATLFMNQVAALLAECQPTVVDIGMRLHGTNYLVTKFHRGASRRQHATTTPTEAALVISDEHQHHCRRCVQRIVKLGQP